MALTEKATPIIEDGRNVQQKFLLAIKENISEDELIIAEKVIKKFTNNINFYMND